MIPEPLDRAREAIAAARYDGVLAGSPGLVAFLTGHVMPPHLAYPSRDGRLEKPTLALVTADEAVTVGADPTPALGAAISYGPGRVGLRDGPEAFTALATAAAELGLRSGRIAAELAFVPAGAVALLAEGAPGLRLEPLDGLLREAKAVKSDSEVAGIRQACDLADLAHAAVRASVRPGTTELALYGAAVHAMNAAARELVLCGCELQVGPRTERMMGAPTDAQVSPGDLVMADIFPRHPNGWWADSCSTTVCGEPDAEHRRVWRELYDGLQAGQQVLRAGARVRDVYEAICAHAGPQPGHAGHGIGRDHYEEPAIVPDSDDRLLKGSVIALEPGRYENGRGLRLEWAFRVAEDGGEPLNTFALDL